MAFIHGVPTGLNQIVHTPLFHISFMMINNPKGEIKKKEMARTEFRNEKWINRIDITIKEEKSPRKKKNHTSVVRK